MMKPFLVVGVFATLAVSPGLGGDAWARGCGQPTEVAPPPADPAAQPADPSPAPVASPAPVPSPSPSPSAANFAAPAPVAPAPSGPVAKLPPVVVEAPRESVAGPISPRSTHELDRQDLTYARIRSPDDIAAYTPNLSVQRSMSCGNPYTMRGLRDNNCHGDPSIMIVVDGVPYGDVFGRDTALYDLDHVEVLRGPAGAASGRNADAGVITITSPVPGQRTKAEAGATYGNYNAQTYRATVSGPILSSQKIYGSLGGFYNYRDGFFKSTVLNKTVGGQDMLAGRAQLRWVASDRWEASLGGSLERFENGRLLSVPTRQPDTFVIAHDLEGHEDTDANNQFLRASYDGDYFRFTSNATRRFFKFDFLSDGDGSAMPLREGFHRQNSTQITEELRFESPPDQADLRWVAGAFVANKDSSMNAGSHDLVMATFNQKFADLGAQTLAVFGEGSAVVVGGLELTLGARFDYDRRNIVRRREVTMNAPADLDLSDSFTGFQPKVGLTYRVNRYLAPYAKVTRGYKSGGYSYDADDAATARFLPARSWHYEGGIKSEWREKRLEASVSAFQIDVENYQVFRSVSPVNVTLVNAEEVRTRGFEVETRWEPIDRLKLGLAYGVTNAKFVKFIEPSAMMLNLSGNTVNLVPNRQLSASAHYRTSFGLFGRLEALYTGKYFYDDRNIGLEEGVLLENARLGYTHRNFEGFLFANNISDERYFPQGSVVTNMMTGDTSINGIPASPRMFGIGASGTY